VFKFGDHADAAMARVEQVGDAIAGRPEIIDRDRVGRQILHDAVDLNDRTASIDAPVEVLCVQQFAGRNDQAVYLLFQQQLHGLHLAIRALVTIGHDYAEALRARHIGDAAQNACVEGALDVAGYDANRLGSPGDQSTGQQVRPVAKRLRAALNLGADLDAGITVVAQHAAGGRRADAGEPRHVRDRNFVRALLSHGRSGGGSGVRLWEADQRAARLLPIFGEEGRCATPVRPGGYSASRHTPLHVCCATGWRPRS
jgi:hypothetical protein